MVCLTNKIRTENIKQSQKRSITVTADDKTGRRRNLERHTKLNSFFRTNVTEYFSSYVFSIKFRFRRLCRNTNHQNICTIRKIIVKKKVFDETKSNRS